MICLREKFLKIVLMSIIVFNLFDGAFTTYWIESGKAIEVNPVMAALVDDPIVFMTIKVILVSFGVYLIWRLRFHKPKITLIVSLIILVIFLGILGYHIWGATSSKVAKLPNETEIIECVK